jgi:hypothetical protein
VKYLAVMDADGKTSSALPRAQAVREAVRKRRGGGLFEFPVNLEATLGVQKRRHSTVPAAIQNLHFSKGMPDPAGVPAEIVDLAKAIRRLTR